MLCTLCTCGFPSAVNLLLLLLMLLFASTRSMVCSSSRQNTKRLPDKTPSEAARMRMRPWSWSCLDHYFYSSSLISFLFTLFAISLCFHSFLSTYHNMHIYKSNWTFKMHIVHRSLNASRSRPILLVYIELILVVTIIEKNTPSAKLLAIHIHLFALSCAYVLTSMVMAMFMVMVMSAMGARC